MINLDSVLKSRDIILPAKVCLVKAMIFPIVMYGWASQVRVMVKNPPADAGDTRDVGSICELGRSPGEGHDNPLQYSSLENPMDKGAWQATAHSVTKSQTQLKRLGTHALHACTDVRVGPQRRLSTEELMLSNYSAEEDS